MPIKSIILLCFVSFISSCVFKKSHKTIVPCIFERETLTVIGKDTVDYNCLNSKNIRYNMIPWLMNKHLDSYFVLGNNYYPKTNQINFKICNCKDTLWAKKMILDEIMLRHPFQLVDTFRKFRSFDIIVRDSSNVNPKDSSYLDNPTFTDRHWAMSFYHSYIDLILQKLSYLPENRNIELEINNSIPPYSKPDLHYSHASEIIYFPTKFLCNVDESLEEFTKYWRDSMGVDINLVKEYNKPLKMIIFDE